MHTMNNHDYLIGDLLNENDDKIRIAKASLINEKFIYDPILLEIVKELKKDKFSFLDLAKNCGIDVAVRAVVLSNTTQKHKIKMEQKNE